MEDGELGIVVKGGKGVGGGCGSVYVVRKNYIFSFVEFFLGIMLGIIKKVSFYDFMFCV